MVAAGFSLLEQHWTLLAFRRTLSLPLKLAVQLPLPEGTSVSSRQLM